MPSDALLDARVAQDPDLPAIAALAALARAEAHPTRGGRLLIEHDYENEPDDVRLQRSRERDDAGLWTGLLDGVPVGYASAALVDKGTVRVAMIDTLFVHPDARGVGVAAELLTRVRAWAVASGAEALESQVLPGNRDAKNFFERTGMITRQMRVSMNLD